MPNYYKEERPWGAFERFTANESSTIKIITVKPNESLSLQKHTNREEFWRILAGSGTVTIDSEIYDANPGDSFTIPKGTLHRVEAKQDGVSFLEIALGQYDESDITRIEDKYGRI